VRRLQPNSNTFVFRYAAIRLLEVEIYMDRRSVDSTHIIPAWHDELLILIFSLYLSRTTETIARFIQPLLTFQEEVFEESPNWVATLTAKMARNFSRVNRRSPIDLENTSLSANSGRIYFEHLHLHPVRLGLTFTQEWLDYHEASDTVMVLQFIRGMVRLSLYCIYVPVNENRHQLTTSQLIIEHRHRLQMLHLYLPRLLWVMYSSHLKLCFG
jgi:hypothetical protein